MIDILKVDDLLFPVLLGRDAPNFDVILRNALTTTAAAV